MNDWKQQMKTRLTPVAEIFLGKGGLERKPLLRPVQPRPIAQMMKPDASSLTCIFHS